MLFRSQQKAALAENAKMIEGLKDSVKDLNGKLASLQKDIKAKEDALAETIKQYDQCQKNSGALKDLLDKKDAEARDLRSAVKDLEKKMGDLQQSLESKEKEISGLQNKQQ